MEHIFNADIINYLHTNRIINKSQHGIMHRHSTCTKLIESVHDWSVALNNTCKCLVDYILIFNKHLILCHILTWSWNLKAMKYQVPFSKWIKAFLSNRIQAVKILNWIFDEARVTSGVPPGIVLGPTLFLLFANGICDELSMVYN